MQNVKNMSSSDFKIAPSISVPLGKVDTDISKDIMEKSFLNKVIHRGLCLFGNHTFPYENRSVKKDTFIHAKKCAYCNKREVI